MNTITFSEPITDPVMAFYSIGGSGVNVTYEFNRPFTILTGSTGIAGMGNFSNPSGNILSGAEGYGIIQFHGTFSTLSFKVPTAEYWSAFNIGVLPVSTCGPSVNCNNNNTCETGESCNCADCTNGGADDKDRCGLDSKGGQMVCTKDSKNTTTSNVTVNPNLLVNGDFEQGNTGFISQYGYNSVNILSEGAYAIANNISDIHPTLFACHDHSGTGKLMGINAS